MSYLFNVNTLPVSGDISLATSIPTGTGATARTLRAHFGDVIWAADFGVQSNGSSDDTVAWSRAFTAAVATSKYTVMAPAGTSVISSITVPAGVTLMGVAPPHTYLGGPPTTLLGSVLKQVSGTTAAILMSESNVSPDSRGSSLINISLLGDGTHDGVQCPAPPNSIPFNFHRCLFTNCFSGIWGQAGSIFVDDCVFAYNTNGVSDVTDSRITNCTFNGNTNGVRLSIGMNDNIVSHNKIEFNTGDGIQVDQTEDNILVGNLLDSNAGSNINWTGNLNGVISGNIMRNLADSVTMSGSHLTISGNTGLAVTGNSTRFVAATGTTPSNSVGGGTNTSVIMVGNALKGHSGSTSINAGVTGLNTGLAFTALNGNIT